MSTPSFFIKVSHSQNRNYRGRAQFP